MLNESDVPLTAEIQSNDPAGMMSFVEADGIIWMTNIPQSVVPLIGNQQVF